MAWATGVQFLAGTMVEFFLFAIARPSLGLTQLPIQWVPGALIPGVKWPGREAHHSPQSSVELRRRGAILPLPQYDFMA
jgi:hypothetical protein